MIKHLYAATFLLFFASLTTQAQAVWQQTNGPSGGNPHSIVTAPNNVVYANFNVHYYYPENLQVYRSSDMGENWELTTISKPIFYADGNGNLYSINPGLLTGDPHALFRSDDGGDTWTEVLTGNYVAYKMLDAGNGKLFLLGLNLFMSEDQGITWTLMHEGDNYHVAANSQGHLYKALESNLLLSQDDGITWTVFADISQLFEGVSNIAINAQDEIFLISTHLYKMPADDSSLQQVSEFWDIIDIEILTTGAILAMSYMGHLHVSFDAGMTWQSAMTGMISTASYEGIVSDSNGIAYVIWTEGIYKSVDAGLNWTMAHNEIFKTNIKNLLSSDTNTTVAVTDKQLFSTTDNGNTWQQIYATQMYHIIKSSFTSGNGILYIILEDMLMGKKAGTGTREPHYP